jgi:hypothetical protein
MLFSHKTDVVVSVVLGQICWRIALRVVPFQ